MAAALGHHLVLDIDSHDARFLEVLYDVVDRYRIAIARVGIGHHGDVHRACDVAHGVDVVPQAEDADVWHAEH